MERIARAVAGRALVGREVGNGCALIALNGRAGDGKTTLAALRAEHLGGPDCAAVVHGDDFLQPTPDDQRFSLDTVEDYRGYFDWPRLRNQVLAPLTGWPVAYERYDAAANTVPPGSPRPLQPHGMVVVEGVLTARPELPVCLRPGRPRGHPDAVCLRRLHARGRDPRRETWIAAGTPSRGTVWRPPRCPYERTSSSGAGDVRASAGRRRAGGEEHVVF
ncbi:hypothetical protein [Streptomyces sp. NPDC049555]|uniref:hypothetical protein n=1 Tax=Streptomyces sp. NPDC049555 TaxID=3154930 RepID=UPI00342220D4